MEKKVRFRLHKVKKRWVTLTVSTLTLALALAGGNLAQAEEVAAADSAAPSVEVVAGETATDTSGSQDLTSANETEPVGTETTESSSETVSSDQDAAVTDGTAADQATTTESSAVEESSASETVTETTPATENSQTQADADGTSSEADQSQPVADGTTTADSDTPRNQFASDEQGNWYYYDAKGQKVTGFQTVDNVQLYFKADGVQAKGEVVTVDGSSYYFDKDSGELYRDRFASDAAGNWYYLGQDGKALTGFQVIDNFPLYFYPDGVQAKDAYIILDGSSRYFKAGSGQLAVDGFFSDDEGNWYYADPTGQILTGAQTIDTFNLYFYEDGVQAKNALIARDGKTYYYDADNGRLVTNQTFDLDGTTYTADSDGVVTVAAQYRNQFVSDEAGNWYYYDDKGQKVTGFQSVDGVPLYFKEDGVQAKGELVTVDGNTYYFDPNSGARVTGLVQLQNEMSKRYFGQEGKMVTDDFVTVDGNVYYFDQGGQTVFLSLVSDKSGHWYYFSSGYDQGKEPGAFKGLLTSYSSIERIDRSGDSPVKTRERVNGESYYFDPETRQMVTNQWVTLENGDRYYFGNDGKSLRGFQTIDNQIYYFQNTGKLVTNGYVVVDNARYYLEANGQAAKNQFKEINGSWYYFAENAKAVTGFQNINGQELYFAASGAQAKGELVTVDGKTYYFDPDSGEKWVNRQLQQNGKTYTFDAEGVATVADTEVSYRNQFVQYEDGYWYYYDANGQKVTGFKTIDGVLYYFNDQGQQYKRGIIMVDGKNYYTDPNTGKILTNSFYEASTSAPKVRYYAGEDGAFLTGWFEVDGDRYRGQEKTTYGKDSDVGRLETGISDYAFDADGKLLTDGVYYGSSGSYVIDAEGKKVSGFHEYDGRLYYAANGRINAYDGWQVIDGHLIHFDKVQVSVKYNKDKYTGTDLAAVTRNQTINYNGYTLTLDENGRDLAFEESSRFNQLVTENGSTYLYDNGQKVTGFQTYGPATYYFEADGKQVRGKEVTIDGKNYRFDSLTGLMTKNQFAKNYRYDGSPRYPEFKTRYYGADGIAVTGWQTIGGKQYYFEDDGDMVTGSTTVGGVPYVFDNTTGALISGGN